MKHRFDKKRVVYSAAYLSVTMILLQIALWMNPLAAETKLWRYLQQLAYALAIIFAAVTLSSLRKLIPKTLRRAIAEKFREVVRRALSAVKNASLRVLRIFGISTARYKKRKDERSFVFDLDELGIVKKIRSIRGSTKYRDLTENAEKIRFIYIKYMIKRIKGGYKLPPCQTPTETKLDLELTDADGELVELYNGARYSGGSVIISDEEVAGALSLIK